MPERVTGRHRAPRPARTPFTPLVAGVGERMNRFDRVGVVVAVSTGLLATGGIPLVSAQAATLPVRLPDGGPSHSLAMSAQPGDAVLASGAALSAPVDADVAFGMPSFTVTPRPAPQPVAVRASRTAERTATTKATTTRASTSGSTSSAVPAATGTRGARVLAIAARYVGVPYVYGGNTPNGFDCSGYTKYVFAQVGVKLPRTADQQMGAGRQISRSQARPGDLVAFVSGGSAYHIAIYAGGNMIYDAGRSGGSITKREIWTATTVFIRV